MGTDGHGGRKNLRHATRNADWKVDDHGRRIVAKSEIELQPSSIEFETSVIYTLLICR